MRSEYGIHKLYMINNKATKWKYLYKLKKQDGDGCIDCGELCESDIIKSSSNIIDLLETGDIIHYQNEYIDFISPVIVYDDGEIASNLYDSDGYIFLDKEIDENNIKSIVTKEQFERISYEVK